MRLQLRIILYLGGAIGGALLIGFAATSNLLVIAFVALPWYGAALCFSAAYNRFEDYNLRSQARAVGLGAASFPLAAPASVITSARRGYRSRVRGPNHQGERLETSGFIAFGLVLFLFGVTVLGTTFRWSEIASIIVGPAMLAAAWLLLRRYTRLHREWVRAANGDPNRFAEGGHAGEVFRHSIGIVVLVLAGVAILYFGLHH